MSDPVNNGQVRGGLERLIGALCNVLMGVACLLGFLMMMHITADVAGRVLFDQPFDATIEIVSGYYMVALIFLPLAYIAAGEGHIIVELFTSGLSHKGLFRLEVFVKIVTITYMTVFAWQTGVEAIDATEIGEVWETASGFVPIWPSRWFLPVSCGLMAAYVLARLLRDIREASRG
jgi:TRAP-type C4-dicarboxylate transport system permease small subunit